MRISDWSSDVCSSDLTSPVENHPDSASGKQGTASSGRFTPRHPESARTLVHMGTGKRGCCDSCGWILRFGEAGGARSASICWQERKSVVWGKSVSVRVDLGGRRIMKNNMIERVNASKRKIN